MNCGLVTEWLRWRSATPRKLVQFQPNPPINKEVVLMDNKHELILNSLIKDLELKSDDEFFTELEKTNIVFEDSFTSINTTVNE